MGRLVIVSNRVPLPSERGPRAGGLAVALADALRPGSLWFGWSGKRPAPPTAQAAAAAGRHHLRDHRPVRGGIPVVLCQLRQRRVLAAAAFPARPGQLPARGLRGLPRGQPPVRRGAGAAAAPRRPDLGARLPPVSAGRGAARAWREQSYRLLPAHAVRAAGAAARPAARRRTAARHVRLRRGGLPYAHLPGLPGLRQEILWRAIVETMAFIFRGRHGAGDRRSDRHRRRELRRDRGARRTQRRDGTVAREPGRPCLGDRRRPAGLLQGPGQPLRGVRPAAGPLSGSTGGRSASCRSPRARARSPAATSGCDASWIASSATSTAASRNSTGCRCAT